MEIRPAVRDDHAEIEDIARRSFQESYSLSPAQIDVIVGGAFAEDTLAGRIDDPDVLLFVAEDTDEGGVLGFVDTELGEEGVLRWLHVDPIARGKGVGTALVERVQADLSERGLPLVARVLEEASEGSEFLERFGLHQSGSAELEVEGDRFFEHVYTAAAEDHEPNEPAVEIPDHVDVDGRKLPVDRETKIPGTEAPFFHIYADESREEKYGYLCSNCGNTDVTTDGLDRLECGNCGNRHLADDWDAAYL